MNKQKLSNKLNIFKQKFPNIEINEVQYNSGFEHYIIDINDLYICKIAKENHLGLQKEAKLLASLKGKLKTPIPEVLFYDRDLLIYKKIKGVELSNDLYDKLSTTQKNKLAKDLAYFLYELHNALYPQELNELKISKNDWPWACEKLEKQAIKIKDLELINIWDTFIKEYKTFTKDNAIISLLHNDMILRNIIVNAEGELRGIIDFTDITIGKFYIDLRLNYTSIPELSKQIAQHYSLISGINFNLSVIYIYYMATEFSRYIQMLDTNDNQLNIVEQRIIECYNFYKH